MDQSAFSSTPKGHRSSVVKKGRFEMSTAQDQSAPSAGSEVGIAGIVVGILLTAPAVLLSFRYVETVAQFEAVFKGFGADLPGLTRFILSHSLLIAIAFAACTVCQVVLLVLLIANRTFNARRWFWLAALVTLGATLTTIVALYLPIFKLGAPI
jgi:type II secretory pathway component PulF